VAWAAVSGQNANNSLNGTATSFTVTLPGNATIGNRVSLQVVAAGNGFTPTVGVTGLGATWAEDTFTTGANGGFNERGSIWSVIVASATTTITVAITGGPSASTFGAAGGQEYSGLASAGGSGDVDVSNSSTGTTGTPTTTTAVTTAANELVVGGYGDDGFNTAKTVGAGFTSRSNNSPSSVSQTFTEDKDSAASGGAQTANTGNATTQRWFMSGAVYKIAAGAAQDTPELRGRPYGLRGQSHMTQILAQ
jgi:hypothetical protein